MIVDLEKWSRRLRLKQYIQAIGFSLNVIAVVILIRNIELRNFAYLLHILGIVIVIIGIKIPH